MSSNDKFLWGKWGETTNLVERYQKGNTGKEVNVFGERSEIIAEIKRLRFLIKKKFLV
jgi:hypothetical protein